MYAIRSYYAHGAEAELPGDARARDLETRSFAGLIHRVEGAMGPGVVDRAECSARGVHEAGAAWYSKHS